jgi:nicotinamide mononucleotide transporter
MQLTDWISDNYIELFGAITGIIYVFLEIRQNIWLWPVGIITSGVYIWIFFTGKLYADMSLQGYYLVISVLGWYWWVRKRMMRGGEGGRGGSIETKRLRDEGTEAAKLPSREGQGVGFEENGKLRVSRLKLKTGIVLLVVFTILFSTMWLVLDRMTDSPVPGWDSFITSLSIIATWMLARKIYEHWFLWIIVNTVAAGLFLFRGLYPTTILYIVYLIMSFTGLKVWKHSLQ